MEFSTAAFSIVCILYPIIYAVLFVHDIYFDKDAEELIPKPEEQDVDISDEAGQFQPIIIDKDAPPKSVKPLQKVKEEKSNSTDKTGQSIVSASKETDKGKDKEENDENPAGNGPDKPKASAAQTDSAPEPMAVDVEARERIQELVRLRRQQMQAEEIAAAKEKDGASPKVVVEANKHQTEKDPTSGSPVVYVSANEGKTSKSEPSKSGQDKKRTQSKVVTDVESSKADSDKANENKMPEGTTVKGIPKQSQKHRPIPAYFYYQAKVEPLETVYCGGQTAEKLSEEVKRVSADKVEMVAKMIESEWKESESAPREIDEDEQIAIEMARKRSLKQNVATVNF